MIIVGAAQGLLMTVIFLATSTKLAAAFVPDEVRHTGISLSGARSTWLGYVQCKYYLSHIH